MTYFSALHVGPSEHHGLLSRNSVSFGKNSLTTYVLLGF
jgi:hypothetical protein